VIRHVADDTGYLVAELLVDEQNHSWLSNSPTRYLPESNDTLEERS